tara:strand:+ start:774 stop:1274 length:501 start_codon:yes stop_codon:yes gene_type:complete
MKYEQRTRMIGAWLQQELQSYDVPANHTTARAATEMSAMVEDINSEIADNINEDAMSHVLSKMSQDVRKNNRTRSWPTPYNFVKAAQKCSDAYKPAQIGAKQPTAFDADAIAARRMNSGEAVAETYITGSGSDRLLEKNFVTLSVIDIYREGLNKSLIEAYSELKH